MRLRNFVDNIIKIIKLIFLTILVVVWRVVSIRKKNKQYPAFFSKFDNSNKETIRNTKLIELSLRNLTVKKPRSFVTIGGMTLGIAVVVFLVSLGYGVERQVIMQISNLSALKQIAVSSQIGSNLKLNDKVYNDIKNLSGVENISPIISGAVKINHKNSIIDAAVYGVTTDYLNYSFNKPILGEWFISNELTKVIPTHQKSTTTNNTDNIDVTIEPEFGNYQYDIVEFADSQERLIIVNQKFLDLLSINNTDAIGYEVNASLILVGEMFPEPNKRVETSFSNYKIVGVIDNGDEAICFVPFIYMRSLGVTNYSQFQVVATSEDVVENVRLRIEGLGFASSNIKDTINQVSSIFSIIRLILAGIGLFALIVASLGMFNTLTVSLLERTHEVGLMKTMGMKSDEVQTLFIVESLIISFLGGLLGLLLGFIFGKSASLIITIISLTRINNFIDISYIPLQFIIIIIALSFTVGLITGLYPAWRATKISALDALRYE